MDFANAAYRRLAAINRLWEGLWERPLAAINRDRLRQLLPPTLPQIIHYLCAP